MSLRKMEIELNIEKMKVQIMEKRFQLEQRKEDMKRIEDHIQLLMKNELDLKKELESLM